MSTFWEDHHLLKGFLGSWGVRGFEPLPFFGFKCFNRFDDSEPSLQRKATLLAALKQAIQHPKEEGARKVFLTCLGCLAKNKSRLFGFCCLVSFGLLLCFVGLFFYCFILLWFGFGLVCFWLLWFLCLWFCLLYNSTCMNLLYSLLPSHWRMHPVYLHHRPGLLRCFPSFVRGLLGPKNRFHKQNI